MKSASELTAMAEIATMAKVATTKATITEIATAKATITNIATTKATITEIATTKTATEAITEVSEAALSVSMPTAFVSLLKILTFSSVALENTSKKSCLWFRVLIGRRPGLCLRMRQYTEGGQHHEYPSHLEFSC